MSISRQIEFFQLKIQGERGVTVARGLSGEEVANAGAVDTGEVPERIDGRDRSWTSTSARKEEVDSGDSTIESGTNSGEGKTPLSSAIDSLGLPRSPIVSKGVPVTLVIKGRLSNKDMSLSAIAFSSITSKQIC